MEIMEGRDTHTYTDTHAHFGMVTMVSKMPPHHPLYYLDQPFNSMIHMNHNAILHRFLCFYKPYKRKNNILGKEEQRDGGKENHTHTT